MASEAKALRSTLIWVALLEVAVTEVTAHFGGRLSAGGREGERDQGGDTWWRDN